MSLDGERPMRFMAPSLVDCPQCAGSGVTWCDVADSRGEHDVAEERCSMCDGSDHVVESSDEEAA